MRIPRILIAGLRGGSGKTLISVGLQAAWRSRGLVVAPFKKGPDYIDAAWSTAAAGRPCRNLDLFLHSREVVLRSFASASAGADAAVVEGNRGLFDGADAAGTYSAAELAKLLGAPVLLVVDCTKATRTVAASVLGCRMLDPGVSLGGVILNRTAGSRHVAVVRAAVEEAAGVPVLGVVPRLRREILPERHMGLVPPPEREDLREAVREAARVAADCLDLDGIRRLAASAPPLEAPAPDAARDAEGGTGGGPPVRIGVFRDAAFQFYYPENLEALEAAGASLVVVSPLRDPSLPEVDAVYAGGGFPETMAGALSDNSPFRDSVRTAAAEGLPVYAECGGAVFLGESLHYGGREHPMAGVLPVSFGFRERPQGHGYTMLETAVENPFFPVGERLRGHEFHHTCVLPSPRGMPRFAFRVLRGHGFDGAGDGLLLGSVLASYTHLHALSSPGWARGVVAAARRYRARAGGCLAAGGAGG